MNRIRIYGLLFLLTVGSLNAQDRNVIVADPRIELISVIGVLSDITNSGFNRYDTEYYREVNTHFGAFKDHRAIILYDSLYYSGFNMDAPPAFMLYHTAPPDFKQNTPYSEYLTGRAGGQKTLETFRSALQEFITVSNFQRFFEAHLAYYSTLVENAHKAIQDRYKYPNLLSSFYGSDKGTYTLILAPLLKGGGYGPQVVRNGVEEAFCILGPQYESVLQKNIIGDFTWFMVVPFHEFSHSYVNPVTEIHRSALMQYDTLYAALQDTMTGQAYGDWITCINEHLVRANVIRLMSIAMNDQMGFMEQMLIPQEETRGFVYVKELVDLIKTYEASRDTYPDYEAFYPRIIDFFRRKADDLAGTSVSKVRDLFRAN